MGKLVITARTAPPKKVSEQRATNAQEEGMLLKRFRLFETREYLARVRYTD